LTFIVLEGFSGTGKTTLAAGLERTGWFRLQESAHAVPRDVPVADRADTAADFSLLGATLVYSSVIRTLRTTRDVVSEGYLLSDLAYAKIRYELKKSDAYPSMMEMVRRVLKEPALRPDLYIRLRAGNETISRRQLGKDEREKNVSDYFRTRYYTALEEVHSDLEEGEVEEVRTDSDTSATLGEILAIVDRRRAMAP
jgi:thymidylate kinase